MRVQSKNVISLERLPAGAQEQAASPASPGAQQPLGFGLFNGAPLADLSLPSWTPLPGQTAATLIRALVEPGFTYPEPRQLALSFGAGSSPLGTPPPNLSSPNQEHAHSPAAQGQPQHATLWPPAHGHVQELPLPLAPQAEAGAIMLNPLGQRGPSRALSPAFGLAMLPALAEGHQVHQFIEEAERYVFSLQQDRSILLTEEYEVMAVQQLLAPGSRHLEFFIRQHPIEVLRQPPSDYPMTLPDTTYANWLLRTEGQVPAVLPLQPPQHLPMPPAAAPAATAAAAQPGQVDIAATPGLLSDDGPVGQQQQAMQAEADAATAEAAAAAATAGAAAAAAAAAASAARQQLQPSAPSIISMLRRRQYGDKSSNAGPLHRIVFRLLDGMREQHGTATAAELQELGHLKQGRPLPSDREGSVPADERVPELCKRLRFRLAAVAQAGVFASVIKPVTYLLTAVEPHLSAALHQEMLRTPEHQQTLQWAEARLTVIEDNTRAIQHSAVAAQMTSIALQQQLQQMSLHLPQAARPLLPAGAAGQQQGEGCAYCLMVYQRPFKHATSACRALKQRQAEEQAKARGTAQQQGGAIQPQHGQPPLAAAVPQAPQVAPQPPQLPPAAAARSGSWCSKCKTKGHSLRECPKYVCSLCGGMGHHESRCQQQQTPAPKPLSSTFVPGGMLQPQQAQAQAVWLHPHTAGVSVPPPAELQAADTGMLQHSVPPHWAASVEQQLSAAAVSLQHQQQPGPNTSQQQHQQQQPWAAAISLEPHKAPSAISCEAGPQSPTSSAKQPLPTASSQRQQERQAWSIWQAYVQEHQPMAAAANARGSAPVSFAPFNVAPNSEQPHRHRRQHRRMSEAAAGWEAELKQLEALIAALQSWLASPDLSQHGKGLHEVLSAGLQQAQQLLPKVKVLRTKSAGLGAGASLVAGSWRAKLESEVTGPAFAALRQAMQRPADAVAELVRAAVESQRSGQQQTGTAAGQPLPRGSDLCNPGPQFSNQLYQQHSDQVLYVDPRLPDSESFSLRVRGADGQPQTHSLQGLTLMVDGGSTILIMSEEHALRWGCQVQPTTQKVGLALGGDASISGVVHGVSLVLCAGTPVEATVQLPAVWVTDRPGPYVLLLGQSVLGPLGAFADPVTQRLVYRPFLQASESLPEARELAWHVPLLRRSELPQAASLQLAEPARLPVEADLQQLLCCMVQPPRQLSQPQPRPQPQPRQQQPPPPPQQQQQQLSEQDRQLQRQQKQEQQEAAAQAQVCAWLDTYDDDELRAFVRRQVTDHMDGRWRPEGQLFQAEWRNPVDFSVSLSREVDFELFSGGAYMQLLEEATRVARSFRTAIARALEAGFQQQLELERATYGPLSPMQQAAAFLDVVGYRGRMPELLEQLVSESQSRAVEQVCMQQLASQAGTDAITSCSEALLMQAFQHAPFAEPRAAQADAAVRECCSPTGKLAHHMALRDLDPQQLQRVLRACAQHLRRRLCLSERCGGAAAMAPSRAQLAVISEHAARWSLLAVRAAELSQRNSMYLEIFARPYEQACYDLWLLSVQHGLQDDQRRWEEQPAAARVEFDLPDALVGQAPVWFSAADLLLEFCCDGYDHDDQAGCAVHMMNQGIHVLRSHLSYACVYLGLPGVVRLGAAGFEPLWQDNPAARHEPNDYINRRYWRRGQLCTIAFETNDVWPLLAELVRQQLTVPPPAARGHKPGLLTWAQPAASQPPWAH